MKGIKALLKLKPAFFGGGYFIVMIGFGFIYWAFDIPLDSYKTYESNLIDSFYFSTVTITTLGYGDLTPQSELGKILAAFEASIGIMLIGLFLNALSHSRDDLIRNELKKKSVQREIKVLVSLYPKFFPLILEYIDSSDALLFLNGERVDLTKIKEDPYPHFKAFHTWLIDRSGIIPSGSEDITRCLNLLEQLNNLTLGFVSYSTIEYQPQLMNKLYEFTKTYSYYISSEQLVYELDSPLHIKNIIKEIESMDKPTYEHHLNDYHEYVSLHSMLIDCNYLLNCINYEFEKLNRGSLFNKTN